MTKRNFKRLMPGDVIEIPLSRGFGYAQYVLSHDAPPRMGALIRVFRGIHERVPDDLNSLVAEEPQFVAFCPVRHAVTRGLVRAVGSAPIPPRGDELPLFKAYNMNLETRRKTWFIWDGTKSTQLGDLPEEFADLPLREGIALPVLVRRIETQWTHRDAI